MVFSLFFSLFCVKFCLLSCTRAQCTRRGALDSRRHVVSRVLVGGTCQGLALGIELGVLVRGRCIVLLFHESLLCFESQSVVPQQSHTLSVER